MIPRDVFCIITNINIFDTGVWSLHVLPYAFLIHWTMDAMHTFNNIITDTNKSLRPSNSGVTTDDGRLFKSSNRSYSTSVINACHKEDIYPNLVSSKVRPPWVLSKEECINMDVMLTKIIGSHKSEEIPQRVMRSGKSSKSHDTIHWATTFGRYLLSNRGDYTDNIVEMYDIMSILNSSKLHGPTIKDKVYPRLIDALIKRSGLIPPSESCVTLHEFLHVCEQVHEIGVARSSTLYKFEKMNKILKGLGQNTARRKYYIS